MGSLPNLESLGLGDNHWNIQNWVISSSAREAPGSPGL